MNSELNNTDFDKFIMIGDRVLVKPRSAQERTSSGLILPPGVQEKENIQYGYVVKAGPGYPIPAINETEEPWKDKSDSVKYVPLQFKVGDLAIFLQKSGYEIEFNKEKYYIVPHSAILMIVRDEGLFE
jgi:chaperonin GroES